MKKYLLIGAALAVAAAWLYVRPGQPPGTTVHTDNVGRAAGTPAATPPPDALPREPAADAFDDGTEMVLGLRVRKDRDCRVDLRDYVTPDGEMFSAYTCTPHAPRPPHPYASYSDDTLEVMAYSDAEAASLLGRRLIERDTGRSYEMLIRAAALDNDFRHLAWLADQAFGATRINGEPQIDNLRRQYELAALSEHLGDVSGRSGYFREQLAEVGVAGEELASLETRVAELLDTVRNIQRTVHGDVAAGGRGDA